MKYQPGQSVEVLDTGGSYSSYDQMAEWVGLKNYQHTCPQKGQIYTVVGSKAHEHSEAIVVGISDNTGGYLISESCLKLASDFRVGDMVQNGRITAIGENEVELDTGWLVPIKNIKLISRKQLV